MLVRTLFLCLGMTGIGFSQKMLIIPQPKQSEASTQTETETVEVLENSEGSMQRTITHSSFDPETSDFLLKETLTEKFSGEVVMGGEEHSSCQDKQCAIELGIKENAQFVVYSGSRPLGTKVVFSATKVDVKNKSANNQRITASSVEELDDVIIRVCDALIADKHVKEVASLDNVVDKENEKIAKRRETYFKKGFTLGYLYPMNDSYFQMDCGYNQNQYECDDHYSQMIYINFMTMYEFHNNLALDVDLNFAIPSDIGADANLLYFPNRTDFSPFFGGGLGMHWVGEVGKSGSDVRRSGPATNLQLGMMFFRTYTLNLVIRGKYQMVFNSNYDNGPILEVGVIHHNKNQGKSSGWGWTFLKYYLAFALVMTAIGAAAD